MTTMSTIQLTNGNSTPPSIVKPGNGIDTMKKAVQSKDDTCTRTRVRHPTDRGYCPSAAPLSPTLMAAVGHQYFLDGSTELRARAHTYSAATGRVNVYRRLDGSTWTKDHVDNEPVNKSPKKESWLHRGWKTTQSPVKGSGSPDSAKKPTQEQEEMVGNVSLGSPRKSISGVSALLDRLRPRSNSDASTTSGVVQSMKKKEKTTKSSSIEREIEDDLTPLERKTPHSDFAIHRCAFRRKGDRREFEMDFGDDVTAMTRKRSSSDATNFLIVRKTSRPNGAEILGSLGGDDDAYKQLLTKFTCYDLMPAQGAVITIDSQLTTRQCLKSLSENGVRAAVLWDSRQACPVCMLTVTDLLRIFLLYFGQSTLAVCAKSISSDSSDQSASSLSKSTVDLSDILNQPILSDLIKSAGIKSMGGRGNVMLTSVISKDTLHVAALCLRANRLHRVPVTDPESGNPLCLLSSKKLLHFLYNHMTSLPMPASMYKSLGELRLGTWMDSSSITSLNSKESLVQATEKFLDTGVSSLPVLQISIDQMGSGQNGHSIELKKIDQRGNVIPNRLMDSLTKMDIMHYILMNGWMNLDEKTVDEVLKFRNRDMEKLVTCHQKMPLNLAIDRMIQWNAHRIYIVDSAEVLEAVVSVGDVLSFLLE